MVTLHANYRDSEQISDLEMGRMQMSSVRISVSAAESHWRELRDDGPFPGSLGVLHGNERVDMVGEDWLWLVDADWVDDSYLPSRRIEVMVWSGRSGDALQILEGWPDLGLWGGRHLFGSSNEKRAKVFFIEGEWLVHVVAEAISLDATCRALAHVEITSLPVG